MSGTNAPDPNKVDTRNATPPPASVPNAAAAERQQDQPAQQTETIAEHGQSTSAIPTPPRRSLAAKLTGRTAGRLLAIILAAWIIVVSFTAQSAAWFQASIAGDRALLGPWLTASLAQLILLGLPISILAWRWRTPRQRAVFQSWALALAYIALMAPTRLLLPIHSQLLALTQLGVTLVAWLVVRWFVGFRRRTHRIDDYRPSTSMAQKMTQGSLALAIGLLAALPWLMLGALGGWLDLLLNLLLALTFGHLAWNILLSAWFPAQRRDPRRPRRDRLTAGLVTGTTLLLLASALSFNGVQLLFMVMLPAMAWLILVTGAPAWAIGGIVAAPLLLVDTDAVSLLAMDGLLIAYGQAALIGAGIGWLVGLLLLIPQPDLHRFLPRPAAIVGAGVLLLLAGLTYSSGHPGFYGDRLFVVLEEQADLSHVTPEMPLPERRQTVYTTLVEHAGATQSGLRAALDRLGIAYTPYYVVNGLEVQGGFLLRLWLQSRPEVDRVLESPVLRPTSMTFPAIGRDAAPTAPETPPWNITMMGAEQVWREFDVRGGGVVVGQSDSGVQYDHPALATTYRGRNNHNYNWFDPWQGSLEPYDENGHGTHTLGTVLGQSIGIAPEATWFACANLVRNLGNIAKYLDCMQFMLAPFPLDGDALHDGDPAQAADVLNNSWGCPHEFEGCDPASLEAATTALRTAGIFVVASAGNEGPECSSVRAPPAIYDQVLAVGAVDQKGDLAGFSSTGPVQVDGSERIKPDLLAPGVAVLSAFPGNRYTELEGTSMAGPHVAGVVALMWSANPALRGDIERTEQLLTSTARPFTGDMSSPFSPLSQEEIAEMPALEGALLNRIEQNANTGACLYQVDIAERPNNVAGYGLVDAYAAVAAALEAEQ